MKSHFRRISESQQFYLLPWEKSPPQYKIESDRPRLNAVNLLTQTVPHETHRLSDLGEDWFIERIRAGDFEEIPLKEKLRLSTLWYREALFERRSTESLGKRIQKLVLTEAPVQLLKGCARAVLEELEHSRLCFSLVKALAGVDVCFKESPRHVERAFELEEPLAPSAGTDSREDFFQLAWESLREGVLVQELSARFAIHLSREKLYGPVAAELLKKSVDEHRHSDLHWDIFAWSLKKLPKEYVERLWMMWLHMPKAKFAEVLLGEGKCRDYYREVRLEISERLKSFFEKEWELELGDHNQSEKALPISRPAS